MDVATSARDQIRGLLGLLGSAVVDMQLDEVEAELVEELSTDRVDE